MLKKLVMTVLLAVGSLSAFGQGAVSFNNNQTDYATAADRLVYFGTGVPGQTVGAPVVGTNFKAQLYVGSSADALLPILVNASAFRVASTSFKGMWSGGSRDLITSAGTFAKGQTVFLQVKAWDVNQGATYELASGNAAFVHGESGVFSYTSPTSDTAAPTAFYMEGLRTFNIVGVPEPTTFALGGLGLLGLAMYRRRK